MKYGQFTVGDLSRVWRIILSVIACQVLGGLIGLAISFHHFWFMNLWTGAAVGTLPGLIIGLAWQVKSGAARREWIGAALYLGALAVALTAMAIGFALPRMQGEMHRLEALRQMQADGIRQIDVFDRYGRENLARIKDPALLNAFAQGIADAAGHSPNHPQYIRTWYVVVEGTTRSEFELHIDPEYPQSVIGYFVTKSGDSTSYYGTFESKGLRAWVAKYLMSGAAGQTSGLAQ